MLYLNMAYYLNATSISLTKKYATTDNTTTTIKYKGQYVSFLQYLFFCWSKIVYVFKCFIFPDIPSLQMCCVYSKYQVHKKKEIYLHVKFRIHFCFIKRTSDLLQTFITFY